MSVYLSALCVCVCVFYLRLYASLCYYLHVCARVCVQHRMQRRVLQDGNVLQQIKLETGTFLIKITEKANGCY